MTTVLPDASAGADLVRHHVQRRVERRDAADDAARHADRERHAMRVAGRAFDRHDLADEPLAFFGRDQERLDRARHFVLRIGDREARLRR